MNRRFKRETIKDPLDWLYSSHCRRPARACSLSPIEFKEPHGGTSAVGLYFISILIPYYHYYKIQGLSVSLQRCRWLRKSFSVEYETGALGDDCVNPSQLNTRQVLLKLGVNPPQ